MPGRQRKASHPKKMISKRCTDNLVAIDAGDAQPHNDPSQSTSPRPDIDTPPSTAAKSKQERKMYQLTREEAATLVTWLQSPDTAIIWDMRKVDYKNKVKKDKLWQNIASQLDKTVVHLQGWWKTNRDAYTRLHQKLKGKCLNGSLPDDDLNERDVWLMQSFAFLQRQVRHRPKSITPIKPGALDLEEMEEEAQASVNPDSDIGPSQSKARRQMSPTDESDLRSMQEQLAASAHRIDELHSQLVESSRPSPKSNFANYVKGEILNLTDQQFLRAKPSFLALLDKLHREFSAIPHCSEGQYACSVPDLCLPGLHAPIPVLHAPIPGLHAPIPGLVLPNPVSEATTGLATAAATTVT